MQRTSVYNLLCVYYNTLVLNAAPHPRDIKKVDVTLILYVHGHSKVLTLQNDLKKKNCRSVHVAASLCRLSWLTLYPQFSVQ